MKLAKEFRYMNIILYSRLKLHQIFDSYALSNTRISRGKLAVSAANSSAAENQPEKMW